MLTKKIMGIAGIAALIVSMTVAMTASAETRLFRIGTGGVSGTYYPIGQVIAKIISNPMAKTDCAPRACGVPWLLAIGEASNGSVANIAGIKSGQLESGFSQSDVAHWAHTGTGVFYRELASSQIMGIASLFTESIHLVVHKDAGISTVYDLVGKRVSLDDPGSGTLVDARIVLKAHNISETDMTVQYIKPGEAIKKMRNGDLDAFFIIVGHPAKAISDLSDENLISVIDITGPGADQIIAENSFFSKQVIPAGSYNGLDEVQTLGVAALWVVHETVSDELVYKITKRFWTNLPAMRGPASHPKLSNITIATAFDSLSVPLHPGARKYYEEIGLHPRQLPTN